MTEAEWLASPDAAPMLAWLQTTETLRTRWHGEVESRGWRVSDRKRKLLLKATTGAMVREIVGNPFHAVSLEPRWITDDVRRLAQHAEAKRDWAVLPILADALEEAGATGGVIEHLRSPGPHARGCWVLGLLLDKG